VSAKMMQVEGVCWYLGWMVMEAAWKVWSSNLVLVGFEPLNFMASLMIHQHQTA